MAIIKIDNKEYDLDKMSDDAKAQLVSIQECDKRINELNNEIKIITTARNSYASVLKGLLESKN
jgi:archaellum component FlaC